MQGAYRVVCANDPVNYVDPLGLAKELANIREFADYPEGRKILEIISQYGTGRENLRRAAQHLETLGPVGTRVSAAIANLGSNGELGWTITDEDLAQVFDVSISLKRDLKRLEELQKEVFLEIANNTILSVATAGVLPVIGALRYSDDLAEGIYWGANGAKYSVGEYAQLRKVAETGLDAHHAGQKAAMAKLVPGYDPATGPSILVPKVGHTIKGPNGIVSRNFNGIETARDLLARDIRELRRVYPDIDNKTLKVLIELNKQKYPVMRK